MTTYIITRKNVKYQIINNYITFYKIIIISNEIQTFYYFILYKFNMNKLTFRFLQKQRTYNLKLNFY